MEKYFIAARSTERPAYRFSVSEYRSFLSPFVRDTALTSALLWKS